jgi:hypothetical protein
MVTALVMTLVVTTVTIVLREQEEGRKRQATLRTMSELGSLIQFQRGLCPPTGFDAIWRGGHTMSGLSTDQTPDPSCQAVLRRFVSDRSKILLLDHDSCWVLQRDGQTLLLNKTCRQVLMPKGTSSTWPGQQPVLDAWGTPINYRCPGPVHRQGWDFISCGPNRTYEDGERDDIVVGEDFPDGIPSAMLAPVRSETR